MPIPSSSTPTHTETITQDTEMKPTFQCPNCGSEDCERADCLVINGRRPSPSCPAAIKRHKSTNNHNTHQTSRTGERHNTLLTCRREDEPWVDISDHRLPNSQLGELYPGSRFKGIQKCGQASYEVVVDIQYVNLKESTLNGYLNIKGLTTEFPELTTFFEGEIIGRKYSFLTRKWQAQQCIDLAHWRRFPSFRPYIDVFNDDSFVYDPYDSDFVYMRWKEHFLVPDHRVSNIDGASFAGFYYICYDRSKSEIKGLYFFRNHAEWYQELSLTHVKQHSLGSFEFR